MADSRWQRLWALFHEALEAPAAARAGFVTRACGDDSDLRDEILSLLAAHEGSADALDPPPRIEGDLHAVHAIDLEIGGRIGTYVIRERLGEGGMGVVFHAEQEAPVRRRVALKVIKLGMDTREVVARFEAERQALAMMNHPNIARVYDGGATDDGRPYFAMEYVPGIAITQYCDKVRMTTRDRVRLMLDVCSAVQHAHQKGVIHRDIKPSNILVRVQDDRAVPKVIDFGVAKAIAQRLTERTMYTQLGKFIGTPAYTSPEQAQLTGLDVDTRTDIYSLGVLLYELLTGKQPFESDSLLQAGYAGMQRIIQEEEPVKPSSRVARLEGLDADAVSRGHGTRQVTLVREMRGDMDWIVQRAMAKDRTRRYDSASELAADLERYLRDQPVTAGPPDTLYRMQKFVRRHRVGVVAASTGVLGLVLALGGITYGLVAAERERLKAQRISEFLREMLVATQPEIAQGQDTSYLQAVLNQASERLDAELGEHPVVAATIHETLGHTYRSLGVYDEAEAHFRKTVALRREALGDDDPATVEAESDLGLVLWEQGRYAEAGAITREALDQQSRILGRDHPETLDTMNTLAMVLRRQEALEEAEGLLREVIEGRRRAHGPTAKTTLTSMSNLARVLEITPKTDEAETIMRQVVEIGRQEHGDRDPHTLISINILGGILREHGHFAEAAALHREALDGSVVMLGEDHVDTLGIRYNLALLLMAQGELGEAETLLRTTLSVVTQSYGDTSPYAMTTMNALADCLVLAGEHGEAEKLYTGAGRMAADLLPTGHSLHGILASRRAGALVELERYEEAERALLDTYAVQRAVLGEEDDETLATRGRLVDLYERWQKPDKLAQYRGE